MPSLGDDMTIIHVNRQNIAKNLKDGGDRPVYIVREGPHGTSRYAREVIVHGPSRFVPYGTRLPCGARAWLETASEVTLVDEMTFSESQSLAA
jgi:hypothetical protein